MFVRRMAVLILVRKELGKHEDHVPSPLSATGGAFNGTGFGICPQSWPVNLTSGYQDFNRDSISPDNFLLFFQHSSGEIRWLFRRFPNTWEGGSHSELVTSDAKNGTPISCSCPKNNEFDWNVFCESTPSLYRRSVDLT